MVDTLRNFTFQSEYINVSFRSSTSVNTCCSMGCKSGRSLSEDGSVNPYNKITSKMLSTDIKTKGQQKNKNLKTKIIIIIIIYKYKSNDNMH